MDPLQLPYTAHPAFQLGCAELPITDARVAELAAAYERLERGHAGDRDRAVVYTAFDQIFGELTAAASDPTARTFLAELRELTRARLTADLEHFAAQKPGTRPSDPRLEELERAHYFIGRLSPRAVDALREIADPALGELRANAARGHCTREDLSINSGAIAKKLTQVLDGEFEDTGVNAVVSAYARRRVRVVGVALELSVPTATWWRNHYELERAPRTLYVHSDEGLQPKSIVYLTDVTPNTGPMSVYPHCERRLGLNPLQKLVGRVVNSVGGAPASPLFALYDRAASPNAFASPEFRRHFAMLPSALRYNSHFGWDVLPDSPLETVLADAEVSMRGPAGTYSVFDGSRLLHRGGMVESLERVALQVMLWEPQSRVRAAADLLMRTGKQALVRTDVLADLRRARTRLGHVAREYSPMPEHRLLREVPPVLPPIACIDVGASYYPHPAWELFRRSQRTTWIAVEPNAQNTTYLDAWSWPSQPRLVPLGLSEHGGEQTLHVTNVDSGSSLLPPVINPDMAHRVADRDYFFPVTERRIPTKSLAEITADLAADTPIVIKLDTQGSELAILRGAEQLFAERRIVGVESEATLLANPIMAGSGKFWELCQFLEQRGFELLQLRPIEGGGPPSKGMRGRTYLNECDAVFCLTRSELAKQSRDHQLAAFAFYLSYQLYEEARSLLDTITDVDPKLRRTLMG